MSNHNLLYLWEQFFPHCSEIKDYAGRKMLKSEIGDQSSKYCPTIDHIRPLSQGGKDIPGNIVICNRITNQEKADSFSTWKTNGQTFQAKRVKGTSDEYDIYQID